MGRFSFSSFSSFSLHPPIPPECQRIKAASSARQLTDSLRQVNNRKSLGTHCERRNLGESYSQGQIASEEHKTTNQ